MNDTGFTGFPDAAFDFYEGLRADNSKTFWNRHKDTYETAVRQPLRALLDSLAGTFDGEPVLFRPYRDVRFSKDKAPYKTRQAGFLEVEPGVGYWIQVDAEGVHVGGGFHAQDRQQTAAFRAAVDADASGAALVALTGRLVKAGFELGGAQVKTRPRGVPADHPRLELMRYEYLTASRPVPHADSASPDFARTLTSHWNRIKPLVSSVSGVRAARSIAEPACERQPRDSSHRIGPASHIVEHVSADDRDDAILSTASVENTSTETGIEAACAMAAGEIPPDVEPRTLVAVFASPVAGYLMHFGRDAGFHTVLVEPSADRVTPEITAHADGIASGVDPSFADGRADVVVCDHDRPELGDVLAEALDYPARWIGIMGSLRHTAPHVAALSSRGVPAEKIALVHRPVGLNIGSRTPAEIAIATLAGLLADRAGRPGGFTFDTPRA